MNTLRIGDSSEQTPALWQWSRLSVAVGGCLLVLATAMPATRGQQEIPLDVSPEMLSGSLEFYASPGGLTFATPLPYGMANNLNDYGWIWQDGSYLTVTFPSPVAMSRIRVYCVYDGGERGAQWVAEHSSDNSSWVHAADFTYYECFGCGVDDNGVPMSGTGGWYSVAFNEAGETDSFWRLRQTQTLNFHASRSGEMEFYGLIGPPPTNAPPSLIREPVSRTVWLGTPVTFKVIAWGTAPLSYQWRFNGTALPAATTNTFTLNAVQEVDAGEYDVVITNNYGSVTSQVAVLSVSGVPARGTQVYFNDFRGEVGPEWSHALVSTTPVGDRRFLGPFANDTVHFVLDNLPPHKTVTIEFDLFVIQSWDGAGDVWRLRTSSAGDLIYTTFSAVDNSPGEQAFPDNYPQGQHPAGTGAKEINTLGYPPIGDNTPCMDTVYHLAFALAWSSN